MVSSTSHERSVKKPVAQYKNENKIKRIKITESQGGLLKNHFFIL